MAECGLSCAKYWVFFFNLLFAVSVFCCLLRDTDYRELSYGSVNSIAKMHNITQLIAEF